MDAYQEGFRKKKFTFAMNRMAMYIVVKVTMCYFSHRNAVESLVVQKWNAESNTYKSSNFIAHFESILSLHNSHRKK